MTPPRKTDREQARDYVLQQLRPLYLAVRKNTHWRGVGSSYRREMARLWLAALRAVEFVERKGR